MNVDLDHPAFEGLLTADRFDEAIIGIGQRCSQRDAVVYDADKMVKLLAGREGWEYDEALEFLEFNTFGAWVGEHTPIWMWVPA